MLLKYDEEGGHVVYIRQPFGAFSMFLSLSFFYNIQTHTTQHGFTIVIFYLASLATFTQYNSYTGNCDIVPSPQVVAFLTLNNLFIQRQCTDLYKRLLGL